jgi:hypothetical protein
VPVIYLDRCEWSGKEPSLSMWAALQPDEAVCACGGTHKIEPQVEDGVNLGHPGVFPEHGKGQCYEGHCQAWPVGMRVVFDLGDIGDRL